MTSFIPNDEKSYEDAVLSDQSLSALDLGESRFFRVTFTSCEAMDARLENSTFDHVVFTSCDFRAARFLGSHFKDCTFSHCKLEAADFSGCVCTNTMWKGTNMRYAVMDKVWLKKGCGFQDCVMEETTLTGMKLSPVSWESCNLHGACLTGTSLSGQHLANSSLSHITLSPDFHEIKGLTIDVSQAVDISQLLGVIVN